MFKKYLIVALAILGAAYIVHTRTMTLAEEQPFLDERKESSFLDKVKDFLETHQSDATTPAAAESIASGARPRKQNAVRRAAPTSLKLRRAGLPVVDEDDSDDIDETIDASVDKNYDDTETDVDTDEPSEVLEDESTDESAAEDQESASAKASDFAEATPDKTAGQGQEEVIEDDESAYPEKGGVYPEPVEESDKTAGLKKESDKGEENEDE